MSRLRSMDAPPKIVMLAALRTAATVNDVIEAIGVVVLIALILYLPRRFSLKQRTIAGGALFVASWGGILLGLRLGDRPFLQSEVVAYSWMGIFAACAVLATICLVSAALGLLRSVWPRRRRRERWPS
jgi:hypothetical protein